MNFFFPSHKNCCFKNFWMKQISFNLYSSVTQLCVFQILKHETPKRPIRQKHNPEPCLRFVTRINYSLLLQLTIIIIKIILINIKEFNFIHTFNIIGSFSYININMNAIQFNSTIQK